MQAIISKKEFDSQLIDGDGCIVAEGLTATQARRLSAVDELITALVDHRRRFMDQFDTAWFAEIDAALLKAGIEV